ncbi:hypothetical protein [Xenorhabdus miraniensis]|uniref:Uncharacterized protein n=1 Tax=Xenorhabdus miraniensis TaxID=351674 RepID=A0A2D0JLL4_9GAMM|nr:hypothetical protein [Xenorhabdus miraniensis]PHM47202.1 hypothetical protein Xmir_03415 [Xenorhabdus miraniensis]
MSFTKFIDKAYISPDKIIRETARLLRTKNTDTEDSSQRLLIRNDGTVLINKENSEVIADFEHNIKALSKDK